ncbi:hypothetical protein N7468_008825 [Penicillium chermesinum]|uniref:Uncharacterized protein n=1 Tax=Penicillium chermesinum TaxID=63820 RepID=A0A9W9TEF9_9EURO|nr:uncharacterized protein N7468_008825 [Penicillium chermesinum]KAJ5219621.1 hypothetical protein N7468_008825 [Penicillium chermesinum]
MAPRSNGTLQMNLQIQERGAGLVSPTNFLVPRQLFCTVMRGSCMLIMEAGNSMALWLAEQEQKAVTLPSMGTSSYTQCDAEGLPLED